MKSGFCAGSGHKSPGRLKMKSLKDQKKRGREGFENVLQRVLTIGHRSHFRDLQIPNNLKVGGRERERVGKISKN